MSEAPPPRVIAIDGPAAAGKGTLARRLAETLGYAYLDTGLLYRAVGIRALESGVDLDDPAAVAAIARRLRPDDLARPDLRGDRAAEAASRVATIPEVREALRAFQRRFAARPPGGAKGAVLDGRDIGTVICPDADAKLFVTASTEVRARRRHKELLERGIDSIYPRVLQDMKERDARDRTRAVAPLKPAPDAFVLDTSALDPDAAFEAALNFIKTRRRLPNR